MTWSRRGLMKILGVGAVAGPVAAPAFGKALAAKGMQQGGMVGVAGLDKAVRFTRDYAISAKTRSMLGGSFQELRQKLIEETVGRSLIDSQREANDAADRFSQFSEEIYNLPSWSPAFRRTKIRMEFDRRHYEARSLGDKIRELIQGIVWPDELKYGDEAEGNQCEQPSNVGQSKGRWG